MKTEGSLYKKWMGGALFLLMSMIILGGYTRLSGSGLSIVQWDLVQGTLPPLTEKEWTRVFDLYKESPEYQKVTKGLTLFGFQQIFWVEYLHRLLGRFIGLWFLLPLGFFFLSRKKKPHAAYFFQKTMGWSFLLALQGILGWYMVKSGLIHEPSVSPYRLAAHLLLGMIIYLWVLWEFLKFYPSFLLPRPSSRLFSALLVMGFSLSLTIFLGALVAGHKAGLFYNTFPLMNGSLLPAEAWFLSPSWKNFLGNPVMIQFEHRVGAVVTFLGSIILMVYGRKTLQTWSLSFLMGAVLLQGTLGVLTLLFQVPLFLGLFHQAAALGVLTLWMVFLKESSNGAKKKA